MECIDAWAAKSEALREDLGDVLRIAPVDGPNRYHPGFTDPGYAEMNLEVIGTRGAGVLHLPEVVIWDTGDIASIGSDATWKFGDQTEYVMKSGKSYLAEYGLATIYADLLALAAREEAEQFAAQWVDLELAVAGSGLQSLSRSDRDPRPIEALRDQYREPMLAHFGDALATLEQTGREGSGSLIVPLRENHKRCAPIDLFADTPRPPDYPLVIRSADWQLEGQQRMELGAKTGEPRER